jgi:hypothetical protein
MSLTPPYPDYYCLDLSGFKFLSQSQKLQYKEAWTVFNKVQLFNINVSTVRNNGDLWATYYQFQTNEEKAFFDKGQSLHTYSYPSLSWTSVPEN